MPPVTVPLVSVTVATPRSRLVTLDLRERPFDFRAGHAVLIGARDVAPRRPYSIACSPERARETSSLELLIALEPDGELGPHLAGVAPGAAVDLEGPLGTFVFPADPPAQPLLFVAGGTGIAPLRAMIDHVLRSTPVGSTDAAVASDVRRTNAPADTTPVVSAFRRTLPRISVLYSARNGDEFAFIEELRGHQAEGRLELHQTVTRDETSTWAGGRGRIGRTHFERVLHEPSSTLCFICGPRTMVNESVTTLSALGVPGDAIRTEAWVVPPA